MLDVVIVGGGPAGLSAALILGRCRRRVVVVDAGRRRNAAAVAMNGYLTRDGIAPGEFLVIARAELDRYRVPVLAQPAIDAACVPGGFRVALENGESLEARRLLLATGVRDVLPTLPGFDECYGRSVHHCPYCDGWEHRDERLAAYGKGKAATGLAMSLLTWSPSVIACTDGEPLADEDRRRAEQLGIIVRTERVARLEGDRGRLRRLHFQGGEPEACDALFFNTGQVQRSPLPEKLGCAFKDDGGVRTSDRQATDIPGLYLAGDADRDVQFVIVAAAEGATAAVAINRELQEEDRAAALGTPLRRSGRGGPARSPGSR